MIWLILFILALMAGLYLSLPLLPVKTGQAKLQVSLFVMLFIGASLGTYTLIGAPELSKAAAVKTVQSNRPEQPQAQVTPEQITAMVDGLAARLADSPEDPEGWTRLIRSRIVLGDIPNLIEAHKTMSETYKDRPEIMQKISQDSGFFDFVARISEQE